MTNRTPIRETPAARSTDDGWAYRLVKTDRPLTEKEQDAYIKTGKLPKRQRR
jgi:hypothetical protein